MNEEIENFVFVVLNGTNGCSSSESEEIIDGITRSIKNNNIVFTVSLHDYAITAYTHNAYN